MTDGSPEAAPSVGQVLTWASVLLGFGCILGAIYLRAYWGSFGLDPFQFGDASALALVGLTGIGVTVALCGVAALLGGFVAHKLEALKKKHWAIGPAIFVGLMAAIGVIALAFDFGMYLVLGMVLTWFLVWLAHRSPDVPASVKRAKLLPYFALAVAYLPLASHYLGHLRAERARGADTQAQVISSDAREFTGPAVKFVGRLGDGYVLFRPSDQAVLIVPTEAVMALSLTSIDAVLSTDEKGAQEHPATAPSTPRPKNVANDR